MCITTEGLTAALYDFFRREIVTTYGFDKLVLLQALEQLGWLVCKDNFGKSPLKVSTFQW